MSRKYLKNILRIGFLKKIVLMLYEDQMTVLHNSSLVQQLLFSSVARGGLGKKCHLDKHRNLSKAVLTLHTTALSAACAACVRPHQLQVALKSQRHWYLQASKRIQDTHSSPCCLAISTFPSLIISSFLSQDTLVLHLLTPLTSVLIDPLTASMQNNPFQLMQV